MNTLFYVAIGIVVIVFYIKWGVLLAYAVLLIVSDLLEGVMEKTQICIGKKLEMKIRLINWLFQPLLIIILIISLCICLTPILNLIICLLTKKRIKRSMKRRMDEQKMKNRYR